VETLTIGGSTVDGRFISLASGLVGAALGAAGVVTGSAALGAGAGLAALVAGVVALTIRPANSGGPGDTVAASAAVDGELDATRRQVADLQSEVAALHEALDASRASADGAQPGLTDLTSGLFTEAYFHVALESRLAAARRHLRPVAVSLLRAVEGPPGETVVAPPPNRLADAIRETIREADIACRLDDGTFAVVLEDTPENGAVWTAERIRRNLVSRHGTHTVWAGIACYPAHAFSSDELFRQAEAALAAAQDWRQDRIEVAVSE